ncbi:MAG: lytic transglycosylase domain-containing protein [Alphaproteobacteria bacterium]
MFHRILLICLLLAMPFVSAPLQAAPTLKILSSADAKRYKQIFALQDKSDFKAADRLIRKLDSKLLLGHVQFQRYLHPTGHKSKFSELRTWLSRYNDHPEAFRAFSLAMKRKPKKAREPKRPVYGQEHILALVGDAPPRPMPFLQAHEKIARDVRAKIWKGNNAGAAKILNSRNARSVLPTPQRDVLMARVAMGYFVDGDDRTAFAMASKAAERSGSAVGQAHWVAALAAYRLGWIDQAIHHFEENAKAEGATSWTSAAGAFWAGRIHLALNDVDAARKWLKSAARHDRTFYGQLAIHALETASPFVWHQPEVRNADIKRLRGMKAGKRALALLQIKELWRADQELQPLVDDAKKSLLRSILAISLAYKAPRAAIQSAHKLRRRGAGFAAPGFYPLPPWTGSKSYNIDRALLFGVMRQESQFNPRAASPASARGLMQVLPTTANYIIGEKRYVGAARDGLFDPKQNVEIGARYLRYLLDKKAVRNGLFRLAIAYNAGIGNLIRWQREIQHNDDPLLFIEAIPFRETRVFVERVLANYWIYRDQLGQSLSSRDDVAQGRWPIYRPEE